MDPEKAVADFRLRIAHYEAQYATCTNQIPFIKLINAGAQIIINKIHGYLPTRMIFFLCNLHTTPKAIYLSRHGETEYNSQDRIGGDSVLTANGWSTLPSHFLTPFPHFLSSSSSQHHSVLLKKNSGQEYAEALGQFVTTLSNTEFSNKELTVWTSTMKSTQATAKHIKCGSFTAWKVLDEINVGVCDSLTYADVQVIPSLVHF